MRNAAQRQCGLDGRRGNWVCQTADPAGQCVRLVVGVDFPFHRVMGLSGWLRAPVVLAAAACFALLQLVPENSRAEAVLCERTDVPTLKVRGEPVPGRVWCVVPSLSDRKLDVAGDDVSGIACVNDHLCIAVSDENRFAEVVRLDRDGFVVRPERFVYLEDTTTTNKGNDKKSLKELDVEAAAAVGNTIVLIGSHGRSRNGRTQPERFAVYTVTLTEPALSAWPEKRSADESERKVAKGVNRLGLSETPLEEGLIAQLIAQAETGKSKPMHAAWDQCLQDNGLNVEGLAASKDRVLIGLRGPVIKDMSFVLAADLNAFLNGRAEGATIYPLPVTEGSGIRAIEPIGDGFLVLTGTSQPKKAEDGECAAMKQQGRVRPALYFWGGPDDPDNVVPIALFSKKNIKPEALKLLAHDVKKKQMELLVFFDDMPNGAPVSYRIPFGG